MSTILDRDHIVIIIYQKKKKKEFKSIFFCFVEIIMEHSSNWLISEISNSKKKKNVEYFRFVN